MEHQSIMFADLFSFCCNYGTGLVGHVALDEIGAAAVLLEDAIGDGDDLQTRFSTGFKILS